MKRKKITAAIAVSSMVILYYVIYFGLLIYCIDAPLAILLGIFPLAIAGMMLHVCMERIKEIRSGEEDDLSKY